VTVRPRRRTPTVPATIARRVAIIALAGVACAGALAASCAVPLHPPGDDRATDLSGITRWWILIGQSNALESIDLRLQARDTEMVILSDDPRLSIGDIPRGTLRLGYLSVGEADRQKTY